MILYDPVCLLGAPLFSVFAWKTLLLVVALKKKAAAFKNHSCSKWSRIASLKRNQQTCCKWRWCHSWLIGSQMDWHGLHGLWASNCNLSHHSTVMRTSTYTIQNDQKLGYGWKRFCIGKKRSCLGKNKRLCIGWKRRHQNCYATKEEGWASLIDVLHLSTLTYGNTVSSRQLFWRSGTFPKKCHTRKMRGGLSFIEGCIACFHTL